MNNLKVGKYIAEKRKDINLTQAELAKQLHITDRAVSKWERGKGYPDITILNKLSEVLNVSVNEILSGEDMKDISKETADRVTNSSIKIYSKKTKRKVVSFFIILITFMTVFIFTYKIIEYNMLYKYLEIETLIVAGKEIEIDNSLPGYLLKVEDLKLEKENECAVPFSIRTRDQNKLQMIGRLIWNAGTGINISNNSVYISISYTVNAGNFFHFLGERTKNISVILVSKNPVEFDPECLLGKTYSDNVW